ncbi:Taurine catabolism dioxygenase [Mycena chlorophos]|uniref:Taurine catabolism dioxygenase n=1 Tax=Mycena chlorophos TaxID=658473 RepID=A0A8H6W8E6_MYCCL|nr:Taurine catabolism dioxygenase [Mycena chlorophos]
MVAAPPSPPSTNTTAPLGSLSKYESVDLTAHIGTRFPSAATTQLSQLLTAPNSDELIKDLATLVSHRGVVFFSAQDLTLDQQKELGRRLGRLAGNPASSDLHIHPISEDTPEIAKDVSIITSEENGIARTGYKRNQRAAASWHTDITFEPVPSDYAILKLHTLPPVGGDTLWASGYEAYDKLSPAYQKFLETLTALHSGAGFIELAQRIGKTINEPRGSPENVGAHLTAIHPVIRTHPVTGYKTLFVNKTFTEKIVELTDDESEDILAYLARHVSENHDMQVRYTWAPNDVAIWDNRCTFHTATNDYAAGQLRAGNRVVSIGEKPYLDPAAPSRRQALGMDLYEVPSVKGVMRSKGLMM